MQPPTRVLLTRLDKKTWLLLRDKPNGGTNGCEGFEASLRFTTDYGIGIWIATGGSEWPTGLHVIPSMITSIEVQMNRVGAVNWG
jgi:hypothetical protein